MATGSISASWGFRWSAPAAAGLLGRESAARRRQRDGGARRAAGAAAGDPACEDDAELTGFEGRADAILTRVLGDFAKGDLDGSGLAAYRLVMDQVGRAVAERQRLLAEA